MFVVYGRTVYSHCALEDVTEDCSHCFAVVQAKTSTHKASALNLCLFRSLHRKIIWLQILSGKEQFSFFLVFNPLSEGISSEEFFMQCKHFLLFSWQETFLASQGIVCECVFVYVLLYVCGVKKRETDTEKRSMFPQQMGIIHAVQVYAHHSMHNLQYAYLCVCVWM